MTTHDWIQNWPMGETRSIPKNDTAHDIIYYAMSRFNYTIVQVGDKLNRVCPCCKK